VGYDGQAPIYSFNAQDSLVAGATYRLKSRSRNAVGYSEYSLESYIAFGPAARTPG
jgi:hypothetical protein